MSETPTPVSVPESSAPRQPFAERFSDSLQHLIQVVVGSQRKPPRRLKSFLNGTWFGHPLHPVITDVPVVAWILAAVFDIIWLISPASNTWAAYGAFVAVITGLLGALGAIATGLTDWSDTYGSERRIGLNHAIFNAIATILYLISFVLRLLAGPGDTIASAIPGFVGLVSLIYAAYLGGEMVFSKGTGVNHTAWEVGSEDYEAVLPLASVEENRLYRVMVAGTAVVLLRRGTQLSAISATCPHAGGPLDEGTLDGDVVECPWHGSRFCMRDGRVLTGPATVNAPRYDVRVRDGQIEIKRSGDH
ncbi:MAG TPA: Rieske 2Fe-2S domain-containing protein [Ktedonobacteraceae bacterium]|nr:Rieske 2Fe-2S domain-containing protein [Ktedonobacteraceae bacterium]